MNPHEHMQSVIRSAGQKLKASMDEGPGGEPAVLTAEESTLVYRLLTETLNLKLD